MKKQSFIADSGGVDRRNMETVGQGSFSKGASGTEELHLMHGLVGISGRTSGLPFGGAV